MDWSSVAKQALEALDLSQALLEKSSHHPKILAAYKNLRQAIEENDPVALTERTAQIIAHRACCGTEHDPANGKLHGYCVVCGVPWPCDYAGTPPAPNAQVTGAAPTNGERSDDL